MFLFRLRKTHGRRCFYMSNRYKQSKKWPITVLTLTLSVCAGMSILFISNSNEQAKQSEIISKTVNELNQYRPNYSLTNAIRKSIKGSSSDKLQSLDQQLQLYESNSKNYAHNSRSRPTYETFLRYPKF